MKTTVSIIIAVLASLFAPLVFAGAQDINATVTLNVNKSPLKFSRAAGLFYSSMSGTRYNSQVLTCTTGAWTFASAGSISTSGWVYIQNMDATNTVNITLDAGASVQMQAASGAAPFLFCVATNYAVTNIGFMAVQSATNAPTTANIECTIIER